MEATQPDRRTSARDAKESKASDMAQPASDGERLPSQSGMMIKVFGPPKFKRDYDPYEFRTDGTIGGLATFLHLVKCSFGTGVLVFPYGFKNAGLALGFVLVVVVSSFCIWCFHILFKIMMHIASEQRTPYVTINDAVKYSFDLAGGFWAKMSNYTGLFIDVILSLYHFGICTAYITFLVKTTLKLSPYSESAEGPVNYYRTVFTLGWVIPLYFVNCIRGLKTLMPLSLLGNITTLVSMVIILYFIVRPEETGFDTWKPIPDKPLQTAPLFIGLILFAVNSFGVIVSIEKSMTKPKKFVGFFGIFNIAMTVVVLWYIFIGAMGYFKYGENTLESVTFNLPSDTDISKAMTTAVQYLMGVAIYCSYPLQFIVVVDILWSSHLKNKIKKRELMWEYVFRFVGTLLTGLIALTIPKLELIVSLTGAVCLSFLCIIMPGLLEYHFFHAKFKGKYWRTLAKDVLIVTVGVLAFVVGTYSTLYEMIVSE